MAQPLPCPAIAGFVALRILGSGQFGDVFLVQRTRDARLFAAKVPRGSGDSDAQEALLLQQLQHPNIVQCEEILRVDNGRRLVIVMEYAAMGDLEEYLRGFAQRNELVPEDEVMRVFLQIALALVHMHDRRVLHRDLKPKNVLLDAQGVVKLSDFGVSRSLLHTMDAAQTITGTPSYMSPELMDNQPYDSKTDVWSLGCILYELVTLAPPFQAKALAALVMQIVSHPPPQIPSVYSGELDALARKLLAKDPCKRPSVQEILAEPFVQQHLYRLASRAPATATADRKCHGNQEVLNPRIEQCPSRQEAQPLMHITPVRVSVRVDDDVELRRKMFFENQAAAQRNKDRVALEKACPPAFLHEDPLQHAERPRNGHAPVRPIVQDDLETARERSRQCYLENARAAKLNKQRAIEAMKGQAEAILCTVPEPVVESLEVVVPPPAPPRRDRDRDVTAYEALLEEERRRVRLERKLLYERMREQQQLGGSSTISEAIKERL